jgi:hypothetical protein
MENKEKPKKTEDLWSKRIKTSDDKIQAIEDAEKRKKDKEEDERRKEKEKEWAETNAKEKEEEEKKKEQSLIKQIIEIFKKN